MRVGLLLAVSALLSCRAERPSERRCVGGDGRFADETLCAQEEGRPAPDGGPAGSATGGWEAPEGAPPARGGYHFVWIPYGAFGGVGTYAPGYRSGAGGVPDAAGAGPARAGSVSRGGFGATGAAHAGTSSGGHAGTAAGS